MAEKETCAHEIAENIAAEQAGSKAYAHLGSMRIKPIVMVVNCEFLGNPLCTATCVVINEVENGEVVDTTVEIKGKCHKLEGE